MKMQEAMDIINKKEQKGYMVSFEWVRDGLLISDHFPDKHRGEDLIETEKMAWNLARKFAAKTYGKCVNIYVVDINFSPVEGYENKKIKNR